MKKRIVIKIGSSTLTGGTSKISYGKIEDIAQQILLLRNTYEICIVSSGAIATAKQFVTIKSSDKAIVSKQALSAIGQPKLMRIYDEVFESYGLKVAQCLLTYSDFKNDNASTNTRNTLNKLLALGYIPIINENDTVATEEIMFGDNDKLSAYVANIIQAELLIIASDIDGLYNANPQTNKKAALITIVPQLKAVKKYIQDGNSKLGTGGMTSKFEAIKFCQQHHIEVWIVNGGKANFIANALTGKIAFTKFLV